MVSASPASGRLPLGLSLNILAATIMLVSRDDSETAVLPAVDFGPVRKREVGVRCAVHRLQCSSVYRPMLARAGAAQKPQLYISLRPARWTGRPLPHASAHSCLYAQLIFRH